MFQSKPAWTPSLAFLILHVRVSWFDDDAARILRANDRTNVHDDSSAQREPGIRLIRLWSISNTCKTEKPFTIGAFFRFRVLSITRDAKRAFLEQSFGSAGYIATNSEILEAGA
jgi:hypothetical protein